VKEQRSGFGIFRQISACNSCHGAGHIIKDKCSECNGKGSIAEIRELEVTIPRGVEHGHGIKLDGEGESEPGLEPGDLYVVINVKKHNIFERHGDDIYMTREVSMVDAALGAQIDDLPSLNGKVSMELPEGTQSGDILRLTNKGIPHLSAVGHGDLYVMVKVATPRNLSPEQKELLRKIQRSEKQENNI
jgi:molecular chaperone DnaJ